MLNLNTILTRAKDLKIAVIGDLIEDIYIYGDVERISPEAPVPVVKYDTFKRSMGGAGNVFMNILNLCRQTDLYCFYNGYPIWDLNLTNIFTHEWPHARKTRIMSHQHHMLRVDTEVADNEMEWIPFKEISWWKTFEQNLFDKKYNAIVLSDYSKGVLGDSVINAVIELAMHYGMPVIVDAKKDFARFAHTSIVKCNKKEWETRSKGMKKDSLNYEAASNFCGNKKVDNVVVTFGSAGISYYDTRNGEGVNGIEAGVIDVCGAGDTVTAILAIMRALGEPIHDSCELANIAAAEVCKYSGVTPIDEEKLITAYKNYYGSANDFA